jgi:glucosamine--fructose-6-phosphate aminotransferase (isomerizing)
MTTLLEEIAQQPPALSGLRKYYTSPGAIPAKALRKLVPHWPPTVVFTGMGSSLFAAYPAQAYLTGLGIRAIVWETAELLHHHLKFLAPDTLLVIVSQSGETVEVVRLLERLPDEVSVLAVTNVEASPLARRARLLLPMMAGSQTAVSTKTYMCAVAVLMYLGVAIARKPQGPLTQALLRATDAQERILDRHQDLMPPTVEFFDAPPYVALMSRGPDLASAYQGALMLKEVPRLSAEAISAAQFRHGPIEIVNPAHRYVVFARRGPPRSRTGTLLTKLAGDLRAHGGRVLLLTDLPFEDIANVRLITVEPLRWGLGTLVDSLYIQLLAHDLALRAGLEPGKFRIATEVTREE